MNSIFNNMATRGGAMGVSSFPSTPSCFCRNGRTTCSTLSLIASKSATSRRSITCSAVQESSTSTVEEKKVKKVEETAPAKPKSAGKAPAKALPQLMEEDVIPSLKAILEAEQDITELELSFQDNRLDGYFKKKGNPYSFWAFFPSGNLTGPKGFSLSSYGSGASTVEPFLVDEKKITAKHVVFWVEKRLAAQGIIPVWKEQ
ncbi:uncharacterized protein LOC110651865 isoform X1 [Hevea brasiliensis]|uniref:uncharacterized protein LOC110651865 isoform X1 n=1 Tax=Hevea brasiliensis TaxID=3981 RepID=UPI0025F0A87D|nr:uncharacterized protein LOC110651865 isoform X1 [Hevea brasiliensis]